MSEQKEQPAAIIATTGQVRTMVDGTLRVTIEIDPKSAKVAFTLFGTPGTPVALARITPEVAQGEMRRETIEGAKSAEKGPYGKSYELLHKHGFFFAPLLHDALGLDDEIAVMRQDNVPAHAITDKVKAALYEQFGVNSLSHVKPEDFRFWLRDIGIEHILPRDF